MRLKKLGATLIVIGALGAVLASSALAAAVTEDVQWYTGTSPGTVLTGSETITASLSGSATLNTGSSVKLGVTGIECVSCQIENSGGAAIGSGKLKLTGITVLEPAKCTGPASITTEALKFSADWMVGSTNYWQFAPASGSTFLTFKLSGSGCTAVGSLSHFGTLFVETVKATKTQAVVQETKSSPTINAAAGGTTNSGSGSASLTAAINFKLSGANAGQAFGTH